MIKVNKVAAKKIEIFIKETAKRKQIEQFINHVSVIDRIIDYQGLKGTYRDNNPIQIPMDYWSKSFPFSYERLHTIISNLIDLGIIVRLGNYIVGEESYSYMFNPEYIWDRYYFYDIQNIESNSFISLPSSKFNSSLVSNLLHINQQYFYDIDTTIFGTHLIVSNIHNTSSSNELIKEKKNSISSNNINELHHFKKVKKQEEISMKEKSLRAVQPREAGRIYHTYTSMPRVDRAFLTWGKNGDKILQADLHAAQVFLAYTLFKSEGGVDEDLEYRLTEEDFYMSIMHDTGMTCDRDFFKEYFFKEMFYSSCVGMRRSEWSKKFYNQHPEFWDWVYNKKQELGKSGFAHLLATNEFKHMKDVLEILYKGKHQAALLHDAIMFPESLSEDTVLDAFYQVFIKSGVLPKIKIEEL